MIIPESETNSICKKISFKSNGFLIKGTLPLPELKYPPVIIGVHGLFSSSDSPKPIELAKKCNALNIAFFRFDHRGCGKSEGVFRDVTSFEARRTDLISAVKTIYSRNDTGNRIGFFGSSLGGTVCISVTNILKIEALFTFAAPIRSKQSKGDHRMSNRDHQTQFLNESALCFKKNLQPIDFQTINFTVLSVVDV